MNTEQVSVYLCLGSNMGNRRENLDRALELLGQRVRLTEKSSIYQTEPEDAPDQPRFLNMVCHVHTYLQPEDLLTLLKGIEAKIGRIPSNPLSPRPIDIDILFYGNLVMENPHLTIPHPRAAQRAFVLVPLVEIAPDLVHPVSHKKAREMLKDLKKGVQGVFKFVEPGAESNEQTNESKGK
jgi:2-amino-4-hydroxy-6-hydroxymethyldihydropteridine diphosphokinase